MCVCVCVLQVDSAKADVITQDELLVTYRSAVRVAGPAPTLAQHRRALAEAVVDSVSIKVVLSYHVALPCSLSLSKVVSTA